MSHYTIFVPVELPPVVAVTSPPRVSTSAKNGVISGLLDVSVITFGVKRDRSVIVDPKFRKGTAVEVQSVSKNRGQINRRRGSVIIALYNALAKTGNAAKAGNKDSHYITRVVEVFDDRPPSKEITYMC